MFLRMRNRQPAATGVLLGILRGIFQGIFRGIAFGALVIALPVTAFGAELLGEDPLMVAGIIGATTVFITIIILSLGLLGVAYAKLHARLDWAHHNLAQASRFEAIVSALPGGLFLWDCASGAEYNSKGLAELLELPPDTPLHFSNILDHLAEGAQEDLEKAIVRLRENGAEFTLLVTTAYTGRSFAITGLRTATGGEEHTDLLWLRETTIEQAEVKRLSRRAGDLAAEAQDLRRVLDVLPMPVWRSDCNFSLAYRNQAFTDVSEGKEQDWFFGLDPDEQNALNERARKTGSPQSESRYVVIKGRRRLLETTLTPFPESGEIIGYVRDFTDLEDVQAELARHIDTHAEVLEKLGTAIVIYGADARLKFFNQAYANLWEMEEEWLRKGPSFGEVIEKLREKRRLPEHVDFPAFKQARLAHFTKLIEPEEELLHLPDGSTIRLVTTPHPLGGLLCTLEDITDRLALESSYNTLIAVQRETLDNLFEGVAVFGADGRLKLSNPAFSHIWHLPAELTEENLHVSHLIDQVRDLFENDEDWQTFRDRMVVRTTDRQARSGRIERGDGTVVDYASLPLPDGAVLWTYVDVTDSIRAERALRERNEALETADRLKSEFLAHVSYELRTPLNTIVGFSELLNGPKFGTLNKQQADYTQGILVSSRQLLSLINNIIDLASIEAGYLVLEQAPLNLCNALASVLSLTREQASAKGLELVLDCPDLVGTLIGDDRRLKQAIYQLVSNSIQFTPQGGKITLSARRMNSEIVVEVTDTGIGIPEKDQDAVFEMFERGGRRRRRESGAGLGLSLAKHLIELHGGSIGLASKPGQGTKVTCRLPLQPPSTTTATPTLPITGNS
jgi:signal transduction histidine kinase